MTESKTKSGPLSPPGPQPDVKPASTTKTYPIPFPQGWSMVWDMYTQSAAVIKVLLKDNSGTTYVSASRSGGVDPPLAHGHQKINGTGLQLTVTIPVAGFKEQINTYVIYDKNSAPAGYGFDLVAEDWVDEDYNDLYVSLVCWKKYFELER